MVTVAYQPWQNFFLLIGTIVVQRKDLLKTGGYTRRYELSNDREVYHLNYIMTFLF